jgi:tryptophan 2,3-dioxygenase
MLRSVATHEAPPNAEDYSEPILPGAAKSDYERYLNTDELLALQKGPDEWVHRDELLFQTVHQSSELWLKLAWNDVEAAAGHVGAGEIEPALRLLRRSAVCLVYATNHLDMLEHMSPWEYQEIRKVLGHGSGFDSPGWREIRRVTPLLGQAFHRLREEAGLSVVDLYVRGREHELLYQLAEALIEWDERITIWRVRHYKVVARVIGDAVVGTQGTPVEVLGRLIHHSFFPELWRARNDLTALSQQQA